MATPQRPPVISRFTIAILAGILLAFGSGQLLPQIESRHCLYAGVYGLIAFAALWLGEYCRLRYVTRRRQSKNERLFEKRMTAEARSGEEPSKVKI